MKAITVVLVALVLLAGCGKKNPISIPVPRSQFHSKISLLPRGDVEAIISWESNEGYIAVDNVVFDTPKGKISLYSVYGDTARAGGGDLVRVIHYGDTLDQGSYQLWATGRPFNSPLVIQGQKWDLYYYSDTSSANWPGK